MAKMEPVCTSGPKWLRYNAANNWAKIGLSAPCKIVFAPFTGQDYQAYSTFLHAVNLYAYGDGEGRRHALGCMRHAVLSMQPSVRWIARETIPHVLDWGDRETLWPKILAATEQESA